MFFLILILDAVKLPFHASQKNVRCNHWMLTYEIFLRTFTCIIFFHFPGLAKLFKWGISNILCLHRLLFNFGFFSVVTFCLAVSTSSNRSINSSSASSISLWLGAIPDTLSSALHFDLYFFIKKLYRSLTDLGVTLKLHKKQLAPSYCILF